MSKPSKKEKPNRKRQDRAINDLLTVLESSTNKNITSIADSIKKATESQIKKDEVVIKLANTILDMLSPLFQTDKEIQQAEDMSKVSYASGTRYTRDEVLDLIKTMREERASFYMIADYLTKKEIPTFSGRGKWHAQTVHRLCVNNGFIKKSNLKNFKI